MSDLSSAFEVGRLYSPLSKLASARYDIDALFLSIPGLRGYWPMSACDSSGNAIDVLGQNHLTYNSGPLYSVSGLAHFVDFDGATDYFSHNDSAEFDVSATETFVSPLVNGMTLGGWFYFLSTGQQHFLGKWNSTGNQRSYLLQKNSSEFAQVNFTADGSTIKGAASTTPFVLDRWYFVVGALSTGIASSIRVNGLVEPGTFTSTVYNSSAQFVLGASASFSSFFHGYASRVFLAAAYVPDTFTEALYQASRSIYGV